jgi:hypothetical protein
MKVASAGLLLIPCLALGAPPGVPMSDFGPNQVSLGLFFDHSGQDLYESSAPSMLNSTGLAVEYAPWPYLAIGGFAGGAEFDVDVPDALVNDDSAFGFNGEYSFYGGGSLKLATPRFASGTTRLVAQATGAYFNAEDENENVRKGIMTNSGLTVQALAWGRLNLVIGAEFQALLQGEQTSPVRKDPEPFGISAPGGPVDYMRGIVGVEYYFKGVNKPFISVAFRPTGATGWHDNLGLRNGSIAITLGAMATLPAKGKNQINEEEPGLAED